MEIRLLQESEANAWDAYLDKATDAIAWQAYGWSQVLAEHYRFEFLPFAAFDSKKICGVVPLYASHGSKGVDLVSVPHAVAGGIVGDTPAVRSALLDRILQEKQARNARSLTLKQYKVRIDGELGTDENYYNRELTLQRKPEKLLEQFAPQNCQALQTVNPADVQLEYPSADVKGFYHTLLAWSHRNGMPCVSFAWVRSLTQTSGMYRIAVLRKHDAVVAATLVKEYKDTISFPFTATGKGVPDHSPLAYWLYWRLIGTYCEKGFRIFHSGRIPRSNQVPAFRLGWGGDMQPYFYQYHPGRGATTEHARKRGIKRKLFTFFWRRLPVPAARLLGPQIIKIAG